MKGGDGWKGGGAAVGLWIGLALPCGAGPQGEEPDPSCLVPVLLNGDFAEAPDAELGGAPWWLPIGPGGRVVHEGGEPELLLRGEQAGVVQPVAVYAPWIDDVVLRGRYRGTGSITIYGGGTYSQDLVGDPSLAQDFEVTLGEVHDPANLMRPRLRIEFAGASDSGAPRRFFVSEVQVLAPLPCPPEERLRERVLAHLSSYIDRVLEVQLDDVGPRATPFPCFDVDALSGRRLGEPFRRVGDVAFYDLMLRAWRAAPEPAWEEALGTFLEAYLELCLHPETGLEVRWDPRADRRLDDHAVEIHRGLAFLLDMAAHGPQAHRARALAAAERMARSVLEHGVQPDGEVATLYLPADGTPRFDVAPLRRLHVPAQLARLAGLTADAELAVALVHAAEEACLTLAYDHYWPGDWQNVDPGFDDDFGNYGTAAVTMWEAHPDNPVFRSLVLSGYRRYAPLWRNALRYGGNVAADQVRCWRIFARVARLEPDLAPEVGELLLAAARSHFKGEQVAGGAWIDTTIKRFHHVEVPVGDLGGVPQNLLEGLGVVYAQGDLGLASDEVRAMFAAVLATTEEVFGRPHGFVSRGTAPDAAEIPSYYGSTRMAWGLVAMLEAL